MKLLSNRARMRELNERDEQQQLALLAKASLAQRLEREISLCNLAIELHRAARGRRPRKDDPLERKEITFLQRVRAPPARKQQ